MTSIRDVKGFDARDLTFRSFIDGEQADPTAVGLGQVGAMQFFVTKSADQKVPVVDERVLHAGLSEVGRELRLPHALGEPQAGR